MTQEIEPVKFSFTNQHQFSEYKFAASIPEILLIYGHPRIPAGVKPGIDISTTFDIDSHRWVMERIWFTTPTRISGLLHMAGPVQTFFMGYKCGKCDRIFLVPDIKDLNGLSDAMRHFCHV